MNGMKSRITSSLLMAVAMVMCASHAVAQIQPARRLPNGEIAQPADEQPRPAPDGPHPKIRIDTEQVDFGTILDDKLTDPREIKFTNVGDETLIISSVSSSCGCTQPELEKLEYAPGESGVMEVRFKPEGKKGRSQQHVTIVCNDPTAPAAGVKIDVVATIRPVVEVDPKLVNFSAVRKGEIMSSIVTVTGIGEDFKVTEVSTIGDPSITATILGDEMVTDEDGRPMRRYEIEVFADGTAKPGFLRCSLQIFTTHPTRKTVDAAISGQVLGDIAISEPQVRLGAVSVGEANEHKVTIKSRSGTPFAISDITENSNLPSKVEWSLASRGKVVDFEDGSISDEYELTMKIPAVERAGGLRGTLTLHTNLEDEQKVQFLFFGTVRHEGASAQVGPIPPAATQAGTQSEPTGDPDRAGGSGDK
jgi:hypothetical protein